ncbi:MAG: vanadium-dependent haloperoxidase [Planctomycetota bacterium]
MFAGVIGDGNPVEHRGRCNAGRAVLFGLEQTVTPRTHSHISAHAIATAVAAVIPLAAATAANADVVLDWNAVASDVFAATDHDLQNPGLASRSMAMMNLAIYDSIAAASAPTSAGTFYDHGTSLDAWSADAHREVAAAQAAYTILSATYGDQQATLDAALQTSLAGYANTTTKTNAVALGTQVGQAILARRANDGYDGYTQYQATNVPGHWQPDPVNPGQEAWGPGWGDLQPFMMHSTDAYMPATMPAMDSAEYAASFNEVKALGSVDSTARTAEQTEIGLFWAYDRAGLGTPMPLFNQVLRNISVDQGNSLEDNAALFAKASVAIADAGIVAWDSKFEFDLWRPVTGIRAADTDGNPLTEADPNWTPLGAPDGEDHIGFTPPFPTYLSGHATFGGALFGTLIEFYGTDDITFSLTSVELELLLGDPELQELYGIDLDDAERTFTSLTEAMAENGRSRVYLGIHWDYDDIVGQETGVQIAQALFGSEFVAVPEPSGLALLAGSTLLLRRRR